MSEPEGFLSRWARRKRESGEAAQTDRAPDQSLAARPSAEPSAPTGADMSALEQAPPSVDLSALPPIDSITATTDIRPFLAPGVPAELTRAALRRAWVADPQIRHFIGIAENQWDFTDPNAIPGFGALNPLDDVRRLVATVLGEQDGAVSDVSAPGEEKTSPIEPSGEGLVTSGTSEADAAPGEAAARDGDRPPPAAPVPCSDTSAGRQKDEAAVTASTAPARRGHGGALPR